MEMNEQKSLQIIEEMICKAKNEYSENGFMYLLWGWLVLIASIGHYFLLQAGYPYPFATWALMPLGGIFSAVYSIRQNRLQRVKTYTDTVMQYTWTAFLVVLGIILFMMSRLQINTYPVIMALYGIPTFISGGVLKHKPLVIGGMLCWALSLAAFFVPFDVQLLLLAMAVSGAYIVPGHLLRKKYAMLKHTS